MKYEYWFAGIRNIPDRTKIKLKEKAGTAEAIYYIEETALRKMQLLKEQEIWKLLEAKKKEELDRNYEAMRQKGISVIPWGEKEYPGRLKEIYDPPYALYVKGKLPDNTARAAAIVGARSCTPYGEKYALEYGKKLAECGIQVISGLARGVDGIGQRGALLGGGKTFAVLGSGVDVCYPKNHMGLYLDILEQEGGILSELPPGTPPLPQHFPRRNRIISALSDIVLVMEARERSGSLITADLALEQGKDVYALPGPVNSSLSQGCNRLIFQGAGILLSPENLLDEMGIAYSGECEKSDKNEKMLESPEYMVYSCVGLYPKSVGQLTEETKLRPEEVLKLLVSLELQGYIREISKNYYIKVKWRREGAGWRKCFNGTLSGNCGVTGESEDDQKISWKELYSSGIKRACQRFAEKSARNRCGA